MLINKGTGVFTSVPNFYSNCTLNSLTLKLRVRGFLLPHN
nr:MAG TPA: hypothetical protein [Caudoviricetes sp.]DAN81286.1 MAG TPA: hypothetical protein [Caudoviricetes sp.]